MKMALDTASGVNVVRSYQPGRVTIRDQRFEISLIVFPDEIRLDWPPRGPGELAARHLKPVLERPPEVLILGTGDRQVFPEPATFVTLMDMGIGFEVMDNAAACRTYNILLSEGRRAALALLLPGAQ
jgi:uncharacterized protein